jgi:muconate cycloisomerase
MKITSFELFRISVPFAKPYNLSKVYGTIYDAQAVILKIHTDEGIVGLGEADPMVPFTEESPASVMAAIRDYLAPLLTGQDPLDTPALEARMDEVMYGNNTAKGAINMALYDILGKCNDVPVYTLLGGRFISEIPIGWGIGSGSSDEDIRTIEEKMGEGFRTFMLKMGTLSIDHEVKRIKAIAKRFGSDICLLVDANQGWKVSETLEFISGLQGYRLDLMEQPVARWNLNGLKRIRAHSPWPLSADESVVSIQDAVNLIQEQAVDVFSIKVSKNGGLRAAKSIAILAEAFGMKCLMNSMLEFGITQAASLHLGCTLTNLLDVGHCYFSPLRLSDDVTNYSDHIHQAKVRVPDAPGLGVTIDDLKLKKYTNDYLKINGS